MSSPTLDKNKTLETVLENDLSVHMSPSEDSLSRKKSSVRTLEDALSIDCKDELLLLVHQSKCGRTYRLDDDNNKIFTKQYTMKELEDVRRRPFASRLFISSVNIDWQTVWHRTRFTDNATYAAPTRKIRDYFKASIAASSNEAAAKCSIADILTTWFAMEDSQYYSLACMFASAMSNGGNNITFETKHAKVDKSFIITSENDQSLARKRFARLMDILFAKMSIERTLVKDGYSNIYRLTYCLMRMEKHGSSARVGLLASLVGFAMQLTLIVYVNLALKHRVHELNCWRMVPLSLLSAFLSILLVWPSMKNFSGISNVYSKHNLFSVMDMVSNFVFPFLLIITGAILILTAGAFIDAVLNSAALLFILEIDEMLPGVLDLDSSQIVRNFIIHECFEEYDSLHNADKDCNSAALADEGIEFSDMFLTNSPEKGTVVEDSSIFAPYKIEGRWCKDSKCNVIVAMSPSNFVSPDCLISKLEFCYTEGFPLSTTPRIGYLKVTMLKDGSERRLIEKGARGVDYKDIDCTKKWKRVIVDPHEQIKDPYSEEMEKLRQKYGDNESTSGALRGELDKINTIYVLEGVYMITAFELSEAIFKLRVVGSKTARNFEKAMGHYCLWDINVDSQRLLARKTANEETKQLPVKEEP